MSSSSASSLNSGGVNNNARVKTGYLKRRRVFGSWKRYWCQCDEKEFRFYYSPQDTSPEKVIELENCSSSKAESLVNKKHSLAIFPENGSTVYLRADSDEERDSWLEHIEQKNKTKDLVMSIQAMIDPVVLADDSCYIAGINSGAEKLFGWSNEELVGKKVEHLMPSPYSELHDRFLETYHRTGNRKLIGIPRSLAAKHRDGHTIPVELNLGELPNKAGPRFMAVFREFKEDKSNSNPNTWSSSPQETESSASTSPVLETPPGGHPSNEGDRVFPDSDDDDDNDNGSIGSDDHHQGSNAFMTDRPGANGMESHDHLPSSSEPNRGNDVETDEGTDTSTNSTAMKRILHNRLNGLVSDMMSSVDSEMEEMREEISNLNRQISILRSENTRIMGELVNEQEEKNKLQERLNAQKK
eukprot:gb/GECH01015040.1/.p1 GENE.gb/GECH01015040.1/~~gb/GECH01015040.1/.p1  ORF type:complete len:413 (+),score=128.93 gb/GECH01015040.1/:1-1239(+)